jgi:hypothetical protein
VVVAKTLQTCIHPDSLAGQTIVVPKNITHISKDAFTICNVTDTASFEKNETVIVYVYDHSGSMNVADPNRDGIEAFKQIMQTQQTLAPGSHAGYVAYGSGLRDIVNPSAINTAQLADLQTAIRDDFTTNPANGTNTHIALEKAQELLDAPQYENWKKGIVFFSDGAPSTGDFLNEPITGPSGTLWQDNLRCYVCLLIDNAYKGVYSNIYGIMLSSENAQKFMNDLSVASGGFSVPISNVTELGGLMENILTSIISQKPPKTIQVSNHTLWVQGNMNGRDSTKIITQKDSSRHMILDMDILLQAGLNEISITTNYGQSGDTNVVFYVDVSGEPAVDSLTIQHTAFETVCEEVPTLSLMENQLPIDIVAPYVKAPYFSFWTASSHLGDSVLVKVFSAVAGDEETITLYKVEQEQGMNHYQGDVNITWMDGQMAQANDGNWQVAMEDSLFFIWVHPYNDRESVRGKAYSFGAPPPVKNVSFFDRDQDGKLDSIFVFFDEELTQEQLLKMEWVLHWPRFDGSIAQIPMLQEHLDVRSLQMIGWSFEDEALDVLTWVPDTLGPVFSYPLPDYFGDIGYSRSYLKSDLMGPVIKSASLEFQANAEVLRIVFSEPIANNSVPTDQAWLDFIVKDGVEVSYNLSKGGIWNHDGTEFTYFFLRGQDNYHSFDPRDQVKIRILPVGVSDLANNEAGEDNPFVLITGQYKTKIYSSNISYVYGNEEQQEATIVVYDYDASLDMERIIRDNHLTGVSFGPLSVDDADEREPQEIAWDWHFQVYSSIGQFVNEDYGTIACTDEMFMRGGAGNCKENPGRIVFLNWNHRSQAGRLVGSGAYIIKLRINGKEKARRTIGVSRLSK